MTYSEKARACEWCEAKEDLIQGTTGDGKKLLVCRDGYSCGERWPDSVPEGRVGCYEGVAG